MTSAAAGILYCTLYLSTGNILIPLILHSVKDVLAFWGIGSDAALTLNVTPELLIGEAIIILIEVLVSIFILKKQKDSIPTVWNERWSHSA